MSKRKARRASRKEQSIRDKENRLFDRSFSEPMREYRIFLETIRTVGMLSGEFTKIPLELIDFTASFIASIITGGNLTEFLAPQLYLDTDNTVIANNNDSDVHFITRVLRRAQLSCTSLILSLCYIDRFVSINKISRKKTKFDGVEGAEVKEAKEEAWLTRDLFMAAVLVSDKYLADATYSNREWVEHTGNAYTLSELNAIERRFLGQLEYRLFVDEIMYINFVAYLEFSLAFKELFRRPSMSYKDVLILSQYLLPVYAERLGITLRPWEAMLLMSKVVAGICAVYLAVLTAIGVAAVATYAANDLFWSALQMTRAHGTTGNLASYNLLLSSSHYFLNTGTMNCFVPQPDYCCFALVSCEQSMYDIVK